MSCKNCGGNGCKSCERVVITKQGERGFAGPPGVQGKIGFTGPQGITGTNGSNGTNGTNGTNGSDGSVVLYRSSGMVASPVTISVAAFNNSIMPDDNDGLRITFFVNITAATLNTTGKTIIVKDSGVTLFTYTVLANESGPLKFVLVGTRATLAMEGNAVAQNIIGQPGSPLGTFAVWNSANWFGNISNAIEIISNGPVEIEVGEVTIEKLLSN